MAIKSITIKTPAKINLSLRIKGLRSDGYHEIETTMQMISLFDELFFEEKEQGLDLSIDGEVHVPKEGNIIYKAFRLLKRKAGGRGAIIRLRKNIPVSAGLGGGSSDGAATLVGLNKLWMSGLRSEELRELGKALGSDVPFFIFGPSAFATGRGEILSPNKPLNAWILLINPGFPVSTKSVYERYRKLLNLISDTKLLTKGMDNIKLPRLKKIGRKYGNDLERVTLTQYPELVRIKEALLDSGASEALMSGSGPTVFGIFPEERKALEAAKRFSGYKVFVVKTLTKPPYKDLLS